MTTKSKGESVRQRLNALSAKLGVKYSNLETVFLIERLVARLIADKALQQRLIFKGGFVGMRVYESHRYTVDLDALLVKSDVNSTLKKVKENAESNLNDGVWFRFENQVDLATQGEYGGIRHAYRTGIGEVLKNLKRAQVVNFDLGIGDPVTPGARKMETPALLPNEGELSWSVYPIETIIAEKLHVLVSHGDQNSRSKDIHDLAVFLPKADARILKEAVDKCFEYRKTELPADFSKTLRGLDTVRLERGWTSAVASVPEAPAFKSAFKAVVKLVTRLDKP